AAAALIASALLAGRRGISAASAAPATGSLNLPSRGFNLPGWVDRNPGSPPARAVLEKLHSLGFRSVRLPVSAETIVGVDAADRKAMLGRIRSAVDELVKVGYSVIVDLQPDGAFMRLLRQDAAAAGDRAADAWTHIGDKIADLPAGPIYAELLNEPPLEQAVWLGLRGRLAEIVRSKCAHTIVWGPARYQGIWELAETPPLADRNSIAAIHYYAPMAFTHQCENWDSSPVGRLKNLPFPATRDTPAVTKLASDLKDAGDERALAALEDAFQHPWTAAHIASDFAGVQEWSRKNDCPVILDEFGVLGFCSDAASRANWIRAVRQAAEANGIGWTWWELDQGFGFIRSRQETGGFDLPMIEALTGGGG
ncbi:MAG TPA: cellulase family glycosylhydrolase, partial [Thermomicrobiales bacterium]|nr:cellulase family glycosylhydrolase [Thermomicrobiales bacterium]